jgi:phosphonate transport system substrate-binding protein
MLLLCLAVAVAGCGPDLHPEVPLDRGREAPAATEREGVRRFAAVDRNVLRAARRIVPLLEYLERKGEVPLEMAYFEDHETQLEALLAGRCDLAWLSPTVYVLARRRMGVVPLARPIQDNRATYRSVLVVPEASPVKGLEDLRGKRVAFVRAESTSGNIFPRAFLRARGIDPAATFSATPFSGSHYKSLFLLSKGEVDAAFVEDGGLRAATELGLAYRIVETVATIPHGPIVAHPSVPAEQVQALRRAFKAYATDPLARNLVMGMMREVRIQSFALAEDEDYADVRRHVQDERGGA